MVSNKIINILIYIIKLKTCNQMKIQIYNKTFTIYNMAFLRRRFSATLKKKKKI